MKYYNDKNQLGVLIWGYVGFGTNPKTYEADKTSIERAIDGTLIELVLEYQEANDEEKQFYSKLFDETIKTKYGFYYHRGSFYTIPKVDQFTVEWLDKGTKFTIMNDIDEGREELIILDGKIFEA